jgi:hypothetical protein
MDDNNLLRHTLATLAYRGGKAVRDAPETFAEFRAFAGGRTSVQLLAHIGDLLDWALSIAEGQQQWRNASPLPWDGEVARFHTALHAFDNYLASGKPLQASAEKLFQGPIADAFTHVGQLAMLRRLAGAPIKGENYFVADIAVGRTGAEQPRANKEFD